MKRAYYSSNVLAFINKDDCTDDEKNENKPLKLLKKETVIYPSGYWNFEDRYKHHIEFNFESNK